MSIATITWPNVTGSISTLVQYKLATDSVWTTPGTPTNPTSLNSYTLSITDGSLYYVKLTSNGVSCAAQSTTFPIMSGSSTTSTTTTKPSACISIVKATETVGMQIFIQALATVNVASNLTVNYTLYTQYSSYNGNRTINSGSSSSANIKILYTSGHVDEAASGLSLNSITPSSDSIYNYIDCTP